MFFPVVERTGSENAVLAALRRMGYTKEEMTGHGFRSMASTLLHEQSWNHQVIERQLAHPSAIRSVLLITSRSSWQKDAGWCKPGRIVIER